MPDESHPPTIRLRSSPALLAAILAAHLGGAAALFLMRLPFMPVVLLLLLLFASADWAARAQMRKRGLSLVLAADGALRICREGVEYEAWGRVLPGAVLFPAVTWFALAWKDEDGRPQSHRLMLFAFEVVEDHDGNAQWRQLRTWLRHRSLGSGPDTLSPEDGA
ncbi:MAG: hypothetical protein FWH56_08520 [Betaproteobacteria bacterium]|nr:hypothetical protein [Betaproteobacteria bacterium]